MDAILDRDLDRRWLDAALSIARGRKELRAARMDLVERLAGESLGEVALKKTATALARIWLQPVAKSAPYALWAVKRSDDMSDWRPLHIGALLARERFVHSLLVACSLELRGTGEVDTVAVRGRMRNVYGPKRTIDVATQRGVKTLRSLGLLNGAPQESISRPSTIAIKDAELASWLVKCLLLGRGADSIALADLSHAPELFGLKLPAALHRSAAGVTKHTEGVGRTVLVLDR